MLTRSLYVVGAMVGISVAAAGYWVYRQDERVTEIERIVEFMQTVTTSWTSGGVQHSVTTTKLSGETTAQWRARHAEAVAAMQESYPPDA